MADEGRFAGFEAFLNARGDSLLREAWLLSGGRDSGEELLQEALIRLLGRWDRIEGDPEGYLRRIMYNLAVDRWRWRRRLREDLVAELPESGVEEFSYEGVRSQLVAALALLPRQQRAVLVLRYFADASEAETAAVLGCSVGSVKSAASRGLSFLRGLSQNTGAEDSSRILLESLSD